MSTVVISTTTAMSDAPSPPSQMLRVPTPLVDAVKELSRLHRRGYTHAVLSGLQHLITDIDSKADSVAIPAGRSDAEVITELIARVERLERLVTQPLPAPTPKLSGTPGLHPMGQRELAKRLGLKSHSPLTAKKLDPDFDEWSQERDPNGINWRFDAESKLFYPVMPGTK